VAAPYLTVRWGHPSLKGSRVPRLVLLVKLFKVPSVVLLGSRPSSIRLPLLPRARLLPLLHVPLLLSPRRRVCMLPLLPPLVLLARLRRVRRSSWLPGMTRNFFVSLLRLDANCALLHFVWGFLSYILCGDFSHTFCMGISLIHFVWGFISPTFCMGISLIHFVWGFLSYILYGTLPAPVIAAGALSISPPWRLGRDHGIGSSSTRWPSGLSNVLLPYGQSTCGQPFIT